MYQFVRGLWLFLLLIGVGQPPPSYACDGGCAVGLNYANGFFPYFQKNFVGLRWRYSAIKQLSNNDVSHLTTHPNTYFNSWELMGRYYPHRRVQFVAFLPLNYYQIGTESPQHLVGLGDLSLFSFYNIWNTNFQDSSHLRQSNHSLQLGGGIKVPTGAFNRTDKDGIRYEPSYQLGTGSVDFLLAATYTLRHKKLGLNSQVSYKINLANPNGYRLGNQLTANTEFFGVFKINRWLIVPKGGIQVEQNARNVNNHIVRLYTGGIQLLATAGINIFIHDQVQVGLTYEQPIWQKMADINVQNQGRLTAAVNYLF